MIVAYLLLVQTRVNWSKGNIDWHSDEYYNMYHGLKALSDGHAYFDTQIMHGGRLESAPWMVRLAYPFALIQMNKNMGYNWNLGWNFWPGHNYVKRKWLSTQTVAPDLSDPNLKELLFGLRKMYIYFVFLSFLPLGYYCFRKSLYLLPLAMVWYLGLNRLMLLEQKYFLFEPAMIIGLNLLLVYFLWALEKKKFSVEFLALGGLIAAFLLSVKVSSVFFFLLPLVAFWIRRRPGQPFNRSCGIYVLVFTAAMICINYFAFLSSASFNNYLHGMTAIFWYYSEGIQDGDMVTPGWQHFMKNLKQMSDLFGPVMVIFPIVIYAAWKKARREAKVAIATVGILTLLSIYALCQQGSFLPRNILPLFIPLTFVAFYSAEIAWQKLKSKRMRNAGMVMLALMFISPCISAPRRLLFFSQSKDYMANVSRLVASDKFDAVFATGFTPIAFDSVPGSDRIIRLDEPPVLTSKNYESYIEQMRKELVAGAHPKVAWPANQPFRALVLVHRTTRTKHLSNYILQKFFKQNMIRGEDFIFFND